MAATMQTQMVQTPETKNLFKVVAAQTDLSSKKKKEYYDFLREIIQDRKFIRIDTMTVQSLIDNREALAEILEKDHLFWGNWKNPGALLDGLIKMSNVTNAAAAAAAGGSDVQVNDQHEHEHEQEQARPEAHAHAHAQAQQQQPPPKLIQDFLTFHRTGEIILNVEKMKRELNIDRIKIIM